MVRRARGPLGRVRAVRRGVGPLHHRGASVHPRCAGDPAPTASGLATVRGRRDPGAPHAADRPGGARPARRRLLLRRPGGRSPGRDPRPGDARPRARRGQAPAARRGSRDRAARGAGRPLRPPRRGVDQPHRHRRHAHPRRLARPRRLRRGGVGRCGRPGQEGLRGVARRPSLDGRRDPGRARARPRSSQRCDGAAAHAEGRPHLRAHRWRAARHRPRGLRRRRTPAARPAGPPVVRPRRRAHRRPAAARGWVDAPASTRATRSTTTGRPAPTSSRSSSATGPVSTPTALGPARHCDRDHVVPHSRGGPTCPCNLAPLCRHHHRLKTLAGWRYTVLEPGVYLWSDPFGQQFLRDADGTRDVT